MSVIVAIKVSSKPERFTFSTMCPGISYSIAFEGQHRNCLWVILANRAPYNVFCSYTFKLYPGFPYFVMLLCELLPREDGAH